MHQNIRLIFMIALVMCQVQLFAGDKPNVILLMTDDQGYGDLSCHGNPILKTPHLDKMHSESVRFTNFHVSPFCTPTRAALMTGRYPGRTGAYRTSSGRTMMHADEKTIAEYFRDAGYKTALIGKWHLGDNAPHRPQDRGFTHSVWHRCGGIGQASDHWGNDYFDDTFEVNGTFKKFEGYCTDVFFDESIKFIKANKDKPFFLYLPTNAPHSPFRVAPEWAAPYKKQATWGNGANFYGMIANFDHNVGRLRKKLDELKLSENTILIFMTDNGTASGAVFGKDRLNSEAIRGFNAGMRGKKSSIYEGGHRVPFFVHWPAGKITQQGAGRDIPHLAAHIDVLPTLLSLCDIKADIAPGNKTDGISFAPLLKDKAAAPHRDHLIIQYQGGPFFRGELKPLSYSCILSEQWRLMDGEVLYHLKDDPAQRKDIAADHPEVVHRLKAHYPAFWKGVVERMTPVAIDLGGAENPTVLSSQDWYLKSGNPPWNFNQIKKLPKVTGPWHVNVKQAGVYQFALRQWPKEADKPLVAVKAEIQIAGKTYSTPVKPGSKHATFDIELSAGKTEIITRLTDDKGRVGGAYFTDVRLLKQ